MNYLFDKVGTTFGIKRYTALCVSIAFIKHDAIIIILLFWKHLPKQKPISSK